MRPILAGTAAVALTTAGIVLGTGLAAGQGASADRALVGSLSGANEVTAQGARDAGDANGRGSATAIVDGRRLCFGLTVKNVDRPVAAHIHRGGRTQVGPVVVELKAPTAGDPGATSGCVQVASTALARELVTDPSGFYWNIHTTAFPAGAVRGQVVAMRAR